MHISQLNYFTKKLLPTVLPLLFFGLASCSDPPGIKATLAYANSTLSIRPDSALLLLRSIHPDHIRCNNKEPENALKTLSEAESNALKAQNFPLCGLIYNTLGNLHYSQENFPEAIAMYRRSGKFFSQVGDLPQKANAFACIGKSMRLEKEVDSAAFYYQKARQLYTLLNDGEKVLQMNSSLAEKLIFAGHHCKAIEILQEGYDQYHPHRIPERDYPLWSWIHLKQHHFKQARQFAWHALEHKYVTGRMKAGLYVLLSRSYSAEGQYKEAHHYQTLYSRQILSDFRQEEELRLQEIREQYAKEKLQTSCQNLQQEHRYRQIIYLLSLLLLCVASYLFFRQQRNKQKLLQKQHALELAEANAYLENIQENYAKLTRRYRAIKEENHRNDEKTLRFLQAFENRLGQMRDILDIAYTTESKPALFHHKFKEYMNVGTNEKNAFEDLQYVVNEKYFGMIDHLKKQYPSLSKSDLDLCSMLCFGFSANSIRLIYGHTNLESIFQKRSRLREKMNLSPHVQLDPFIQNMKAELQAKHTKKRGKAGAFPSRSAR